MQDAERHVRKVAKSFGSLVKMDGTAAMHECNDVVTDVRLNFVQTTVLREHANESLP